MSNSQTPKLQTELCREILKFHKRIEVYFMNAINCQRTLCIQNGTQPQSHDRGTCIEGAKEEIFWVLSTKLPLLALQAASIELQLWAFTSMCYLPHFVSKVALSLKGQIAVTKASQLLGVPLILMTWLSFWCNFIFIYISGSVIVNVVIVIFIIFIKA